ncbi:TPA: hypothetical protein N0F65_008179 [Lagenidium giganteum]|uniref:Late embryogenesis abundant protein LEA-2 subgroup domain-containing protein n=1 Tax=Lagenidium giganteum TaxID=4803 RepID=A0AAV2YIA5_9STRA|nr:TPA: hypothetical protein N0F65_008179 [Lagenidium giganteum]
MEQGIVTEAKDDQDNPKQKKFLFWRMSKRRRIIYIVVSIMLLLVIILLIVIFVGGKAYAQKYANKVEISVNSVDLKYIEPNVDTKSIDVEISLHLKHNGPMDARMESAHARLEYGGKTFGRVKIPEMHLTSGKQEYDLIVRDNAEVSDLAVLSNLGKDLVNEKEITVSAFAKVTVHSFGLTYSGINVNRKLKITALGKFEDPAPRIDVIKLNECTPDTYSILFNATVDNVSKFGLDGIGLLNLTLYYDHSFLGYAMSTHPERGVPRGNSTIEFSLSVPNTPAMKPTMLAMGLGIASGKAQFYITGENPYATQVNMLKEAVQTINMSILYTDGLNKVAFGPTCDLTKVIS